MTEQEAMSGRDPSKHQINATAPDEENGRPAMDPTMKQQKGLSCTEPQKAPLIVSREFFAVRRGINLARCIFTNWEDCSPHVVTDDEDDAEEEEDVEYDVFDDLQEALAYVDSYHSANATVRTQSVKRKSTKKTPLRKTVEAKKGTSAKKASMKTKLAENHVVAWTAAKKAAAKEEAEIMMAAMRAAAKEAAEKKAAAKKAETRRKNAAKKRRMAARAAAQLEKKAQKAAAAAASPSKQKFVVPTGAVKATTHWNTMYGQLLRYKKTNGTCLVPLTDSRRRRTPLGSWVSAQRSEYRNFIRNQSLSEGEKGTSSSMTTEKIELLEDAGFVWRCYNRRRSAEEKQRFDTLGNGGEKEEYMPSTIDEQDGEEEGDTGIANHETDVGPEPGHTRKHQRSALTRAPVKPLRRKSEAG